MSRRKISNAAWLFVLTFISIPGAFANDTPLEGLAERDVTTADTGMAIFQQAVDMVWTGKAPPDRVMALLGRAERVFGSIQDGAARDYFLAQVELYRGRATWASSRKARARPYFAKAMELAQQSIDARESADGYRVLAAAGSSWMLSKGLIEMIRMGPQVTQWLERALEINPRNALAVILSAQGQINAPKSSGGNPEEALRRLSAQIQRRDLSDIERFWALVSLAQAHKKLRQRAEASRRCEEARLIFPGNAMLERCL